MRNSEIFLKRAIKFEKTTFQGWDSNLQTLVWKMDAEPLRVLNSGPVLFEYTTLSTHPLLLPLLLRYFEH